MAKRQRNEQERREPNEDARELERRGSDESGRDPSARRGAIEEGGSISDADVGEDKLKEQEIRNYGRDEEV
jgi:hypothetical protein